MIVSSRGAGGAAVRHVLNVRFTYPRWRWALAAVVAGTVLLLAARQEIGPFKGRTATAVGSLAGGEFDSAMASLPAMVSFDDARRVIDRRCTACHSATPSDASLGVMPGGVAFDTPAQIQALAQRIRERAVTTRTMPPGNKTRLTERERAILAKWTSQGAGVR